jgi:two-component system chemotaxis response regulator CheB
MNADAPPLPVVALVASAGGLEAVTEVLGHLAPELPAAVLVLIHQAPDRLNELVGLLDRRSVLPVSAAGNDAALAPGTVLVAPPGRHLLVAPGPRTVLIESGDAPPSRPSADLLLTTLAVACGPSAVAVVLSGGGHDGATGATAVHAFGGTVLASNEATSLVYSMPRATIRRHHAVDFIESLDEIAARIGAVLGGLGPARA